MRIALVAAILVLSLARPRPVLTPGTGSMAPRGVPAPAIADTSIERLFRQVAHATLLANTRRRVGVIYPSPAYANPYLRDSFWATQALGNRALSVRILDAFAAAERADGEPPTWFTFPYGGPHYADDESASLLLIWAWRNHVLYDRTSPRAALTHALGYLLRHERGGRLAMPAGRYRSWWDAYRFPVAPTLAYNQGLYAVALACAHRLGLSLPAHAMARAELAYRALATLTPTGYLPLAAELPAHDASALTGEFLSLWLFDRPILSTRTVLATLHGLTPFGAGFAVVSAAGRTGTIGLGFPVDVSVGRPGDYQNGASWLLYDALTLAAAGLHGWSPARGQLLARLAQELRPGPVLHEYLRTNPRLPYYGTEPPYRDGFAWDAFAIVAADVLAGRVDRNENAGHAR